MQLPHLSSSSAARGGAVRGECDATKRSNAGGIVLPTASVGPAMTRRSAAQRDNDDDDDARCLRSGVTSSKSSLSMRLTPLPRDANTGDDVTDLLSASALPLARSAGDDCDDGLFIVDSSVLLGDDDDDASADSALLPLPVIGVPSDGDDIESVPLVAPAEAGERTTARGVVVVVVVVVAALELTALADALDANDGVDDDVELFDKLRATSGFCPCFDCACASVAVYLERRRRRRCAAAGAAFTWATCSFCFSVRRHAEHRN